MQVEWNECDGPEKAMVGTEDVEEYDANQSAVYEQCLVILGFLFANSQGDGHALATVGFHVSDVVDIENAYAEEADGAGGQQDDPIVNALRHDEVAAQYGDQSEEDENGDVT